MFYLLIIYSISLQFGTAGLTNRIKETYFPVTRECRVNIHPKTAAKAVKLIDLMAAFFFLAIGFGLSVVAFIIEMMKNVYSG